MLSFHTTLIHSVDKSILLKWNLKTFYALHIAFLSHVSMWKRWKFENDIFCTYRFRGSSQRGSCGSSYSDTPDNIGEPLEDRREGRTNITPEWMEELESTDT